MASGFLNPTANNDGPAFGLYVALADGGELIPLGITTGVEESAISEESVFTYPNPARDVVNIIAQLEREANVTAEIYDMLGKKVIALDYGRVSSLDQQVNISELNEGIYILRLSADAAIITKKVKVIK